MSKSENKLLSNLKLTQIDVPKMIDLILCLINRICQNKNTETVWERIMGAYFNAYKRNMKIKKYEQKDLKVPGSRILKPKKYLPVNFKTPRKFLLSYYIPDSWEDEIYEEVAYDNDIDDLDDEIKGKMYKFVNEVTNHDICCLTEKTDDSDCRSTLLTSESNRIICLCYLDTYIGKNYRAGNIRHGLINPRSAVKMGLDDMYYVVLFTTDAGYTHISNLEIEIINEPILSIPLFSMDVPVKEDPDAYMRLIMSKILESKKEEFKDIEPPSEEKMKDIIISLDKRLHKLGYKSGDIKYKAKEIENKDFYSSLLEVLKKFMVGGESKEVKEIKKSIKEYAKSETNKDIKTKIIQMPVNFGEIIKQGNPFREKLIFRNLKVQSEMESLGFNVNQILSGGFMISKTTKEAIDNTLKMLTMDLRSLDRQDALHMNGLSKLIKGITSDLIVVDIGNHNDDLAIINILNKMIIHKTKFIKADDFDEVATPSDFNIYDRTY